MYVCMHAYIYIHIHTYVSLCVYIYTSSGGTDDTNSLYRASLALCWLSALHITLCWLSVLYIALCRLPIALIWLPTTRFFISRAPNLLTRLDVELQPPALTPSPKYSHTLAPYTDSLHPILPQGFP